MSKQILFARFAFAAALAIGLAGGINVCFPDIEHSGNSASFKDRIRADLLDADINKPWNAELHSALYNAFQAADKLSPEESVATHTSQTIMLEEIKREMK